MAPELLRGKEARGNTIEILVPVIDGGAGDLEHRSDGSIQIYFRHNINPFFQSLIGHVKLENLLTPAERKNRMTLLTGMLKGLTPQTAEERPVLSFSAAELIGVQYHQRDGRSWYNLRFADQKVVNTTFLMCLPWVNLTEGEQFDRVNRLSGILGALGMLDEVTVNELEYRMPSLPRPNLKPDNWQNANSPRAILHEIQLKLQQVQRERELSRIRINT